MRSSLTFLFVVMVLAIGCNKNADTESDRDTSDPSSAADSESAADESESADQPSSNVVDGKLKLDAIQFTVPEGWETKTNNSGFILAEFSLPKAEEDAEDGRITVSTAGGTIEDNIARWRAQFGGAPEKELQEEEEFGDIKATIVDYQGDFNDQRGPFAGGGEPKPGYRMVGVILTVDEELYFVKATGPAATIQEHYRQIQDFVESVERVK